MLPNKNRVSRTPLNESLVPVVGLGYIIVPEGVDRDKYLFQCFNTGTISFITPDAGRYDLVKVNKSLFNYLVFPTEKDKYGSTLIYVKVATSQSPVVISLITNENEIINLSEYQFSLAKEFLTNKIEVFGDAKEGLLFINVLGENDKESELKISIKNKNKKSKVNLSCDGDFNLDIEDNINLKTGKEFNLKIVDNKGKTKTELKYILEEGLSYLDEFKNELTTTKDGWSFDKGKNGPMVIIGKLIKKINAIESKINSHLLLYNTHTHVEVAPGALTLPTTNLDTKPLKLTIQSEIENKQIQH